MDPEQNQNPVTPLPQQPVEPTTVTTPVQAEPQPTPQPQIVPSQPIAMTPPPVIPQPAPSTPAPLPPSSASKKPIVIIVVILVLLLGIGAAVYLLVLHRTASSVTSSNPKAVVVSSKPITNLTVAATVTNGYRVQGPTTSANGTTALDYSKNNLSKGTLTLINYLWGPVVNNASTQASTDQEVQKQKQLDPTAVVTTSSANPISVKGSDGKTYSLQCSSISQTTASDPTPVYETFCVAKVDSGKQYVAILALDDTLADIQADLSLFAPATTLVF